MGKKETDEAIADSRAGRVAGRFGSVDELLADLKADDTAENLDNWLHEKAGPAHDALKADPARAVSADRVRYTLDELLAEADASGQYPLPPEEREWVDAPAVGREWPACEVRARLHDDAMAEAFRKDPAYAVELLNSILEDGDQDELLIARRQITEALGIMGEFFPAQVFKQLSHARAVIERHLAATLDTIHLFGSAIDGGLKPDSDIDLLVTVSAAPNDSLRQALMLDLLKVSSPPGDGGTWRPLELTVVARSEVVPWRYPARRELQFGEWLRHDILSGTFEPAVLDHDLAILLTKARQHSLALLGPSAATFFEPVPKEHFSKALFDTIAQWNAESDWKGDERNVVLALARIWYSASTGLIAPKDVAAAWVSERLPAEHRPLICKARAAYLGSEDDDLAMRVEETAAFVRYAKATIERILR